MHDTEMAYWADMKAKSAKKIANISGMEEPEDEHMLKFELTHVMRHGNCREAADAIVEAAEHIVACHMLKAMEHAHTEHVHVHADVD